MYNLLNTKALALAAGIAGVLLVIACFGLYALAGVPDPWMELFAGSGPTVVGWIIGMLEGGLVGAFLGVLVAYFYNRLVRA